MTKLVSRRCRTAFKRHVPGLSLFAAIALGILSAARAEDSGVDLKWIAPAGQAQKSNPVAATPGSIAAGRKIYLQRCAKCHGETGKGDGPDAIELNLHPSKFTSPAIRSESDGALFWKVSVGKKGMPDFAKRIGPTDRWNVINFLRTLGGS